MVPSEEDLNQQIQRTKKESNSKGRSKRGKNEKSGVLKPGGWKEYQTYPYAQKKKTDLGEEKKLG